MSLPVLSVTIRQEHDTVDARQRARQIARLLGFDAQDQTRISTAVSEIARNAYNYAGGGKVEYMVEGRTAPQLFIIRIVDRGPGIRDLSTILEGRYQSQTGMGLGIIGSRRLMDQFEIDSVRGWGTTILLKKLMPKRAPLVLEADLARIADALAHERPQNAFQELQYQNQELVRALEEISTRQAELTRVNRELEDTNRGVVALYAELGEKAEHLRQADQLKSKFLSNMSHEFRSPLNSILALSGLLIDRSDGPLTTEQDQQAGYIRHAANDLLELVNDLLDTARMEAGKVEAKPTDFAVGNLFAALRGMLRPLLLNQSVDLVFEDASSIPGLYTDEGKVSQILRNFISNALKFTERGEVRVVAELVGDHEVIFRVADTGIGIDARDQEAIFQDFVQLDHPIQRRVKGTGLGLPLSRKLAIFLGGSVEVSSQPGKGSVFLLRIPVHYADPHEPGLVLEDWVPDPNCLPVLFVEDSPESLLTYKSFLRHTDFQVVAAATTRDAATILERVTPRAIVLDMILRPEDTWTLLANLKQNPAAKDIPVAIVSTIDDRAKAFHLGASACLIKPVSRADLLGELRALTGIPAINRILIIDDNELDRYLMKQHLKNLPLSLIEADCGTGGIRRACEYRPDLIFLDLSMPDMTGFEVLDQLKEKPESKFIPVVIVSSLILTGEERRRLMEKAVTIMGKDGLTDKAVADVLRRTLNIEEAPAKASQ